MNTGHEKRNTQQPFEKKWKKRFEGFATDSEDDAGIAGWSPSGLETRLRQFIDLWETNSPNKGLWLDAGCGAGTYSRFIAEKGSTVIGLDYSLPSLQKAVAKGGDSVQWCAADVTKLPVKVGIFDGAICFGVTQALDNSATAIHELSGAVKPGGQVWIDALNRWCMPTMWQQFSRRIRNRPVHLRYESRQDMVKAMINSGLVNVKWYWLPILPSRWSRYQWLVETSLAKWVFHNIPVSGPLFCHAFVMYGERPHEN